MTREPWRATVLTLFPDMFPGPLGCSLAGKAREEGKWTLETLDLRGFAEDRHQTVDGPPFGGGPGMVLRADVADRALSSLFPGGPDENRRENEKNDGNPGVRLIYLSPRGQPLTQDIVAELAGGAGVALFCGRYEGLDQRVIDAWAMEEWSLGDFILSGGEPAALALIDACVRLLPGVMGKAESGEEESFSRGLLEYPQYTRPQNWNGIGVPDVLVSGDHEKIRAWRRAQAEEITRQRRLDLWSRYKAG